MVTIRSGQGEGATRGQDQGRRQEEREVLRRIEIETGTEAEIGIETSGGESMQYDDALCALYELMSCCASERSFLLRHPPKGLKILLYRALSDPPPHHETNQQGSSLAYAGVSHVFESPASSLPLALAPQQAL